jgi:hypothetical protein
MTKTLCTKGCVQTNGKPRYHMSKKECRFDPEYDPNYKAGAKPAPSPTPSPPASGAQPKADSGGLPTGSLSFPAGVAPTNDPVATKELEKKPDWILDVETNETAWGLVGRVLHKITEFAVSILEADDPAKVKEPIKVDPKIFEINPGDRLVLSGYPRRMMTGFLKSAGNQTLEEAQGMVNGLATFALLGTMFLYMGQTIWRAYSVSPRFEEQRREKAARVEARKQAAIAEAQNRQNPGAAPT